MSLSNKNVVIGYSDHIFTKLYIDVLVERCKLNPNDICLLALDSINDCYLNDSQVRVYVQQKYGIEDLEKCKTITLISLTSANASFIRDAFESSQKIIDKTYIHLTDDEVARWVKTKNKHGELVKTKNNLVDDNCIYVLKKVVNFIAPEAPFRKYLSYVLNRNDFTLHDGRDAFKTMPTKLWEKFSEVYKNNVEYVSPEKRVLMGAKRDAFSVIEIIKVLHQLNKEGNFPELKCMIFFHGKRNYFPILLEMYLIYMKRVNNVNIDISLPTATNNITYNSLVMSCSDLILQGRGSMTTARCFLSIGKGVVHVGSDTPNFVELTQSEGVDVLPYANYGELARNIKNNDVDTISNATKIESRYEDKIKRLLSIYK